MRIRGLDKSLNATGTGSGIALCAVVVGYDVVVLISIVNSVVFASIRSSTVAFVLLDDSSNEEH